MNTQDSSIKKIRRITLIGAGVNILLIAGKLGAGIFGRSQALIADAVHSISDLATDLAVLIGMRYWAEGPDADHPYGHAKLETLITALIGVALVVVAIEIVGSAAGALWDIFVHKHNFSAPDVSAVYAAGASIVLKELLYRRTKAVGEETRSPAVVANAYHHRSDAWSSIPPLIAVGLSLILGDGWEFLDPLGALVVAAMLFGAAWKIAKPAVSILMDQGMGAGEMAEVRRIVENFPEVLEVHRMRSRPTGFGDFVLDLHIHLAPETTVAAGHATADRVAAALRAGTLPVREVIVHIEPHRGVIPPKN